MDQEFDSTQESDPTAAAPDQYGLHDLQDATVWDAADMKLGTVSQVALDALGKPAWVSVPLGLMQTREKFVPLAGARLVQGAQVPDLHVAYSSDTIKDAPDTEGRDTLDPAEEELLRRHYGL
ncbi:PRC-barrel domain-containing protein [Zafaria cholistanensis]|nr:PRC-barrel domain-containing protein [Zafaria cholistanensis]